MVSIMVAVVLITSTMIKNNIFQFNVKDERNKKRSP